MIRYASVCSGIEAASVAWHPLGWRAAWLSEIDPFACSVLAHHYPETPNLGDMTKVRGDEHGPIDLLVGGTPCQSFSVAGLRKGLADPRGNLALEFLRLLDRTRARWMVWENVPGVLSSAGGRDFGAFLGALGQLGYGWAYRVLDAQYFGLAQRRKRVFVVAHSGGLSNRAAAVLLESASLRGDPAPSREAGATVAHCVAAGAGGGKFGSGRDGQDDFVVGGVPRRSGAGGGCRVGPDEAAAGQLVAYRKSRRAKTVDDDETWVDDGKANTLNGFDVGDVRTTHAVVSVDLQNTRLGGDLAGTLDTTRPSRGGGQAVAFHVTQDPISGEVAPAMRAGNRQGCATIGVLAPSLTASNNPSRSPQSAEVTAQVEAVQAAGCGVRRLTPSECEKLQGFLPGYTLVPHRGKPASDGPRYRALGNSMAVPVMAWIGKRIQMVEDCA